MTTMNKDQTVRMRLLARIAAFSARHNMSDSRFGREAMNDPAFVLQLKRGRPPKPNTVTRCFDFMRGYNASATASQNAAERRRLAQLLALERLQRISHLEVKPEFQLVGRRGVPVGTYRPSFSYRTDGRLYVEDHSDLPDDLLILKGKLLLQQHRGMRYYAPTRQKRDRARVNGISDPDCPPAPGLAAAG